MDDENIFKIAFDAMPSLVFVVDEDVRIKAHNASICKLASDLPVSIMDKCVGDIIHCMNAVEKSGGCGQSPICKECIIRNSVESAFCGNHVRRSRALIEIRKDGGVHTIFALVTASPFRFKNMDFVLLVIEDVNDVSSAQKILPVCSVCHKVRDDKQAWARFDTYFNRNWKVDFTHGYCPECYKSELEKLRYEMDTYLDP